MMKKIAVVVGGSRGIGFAISCKLTEVGCFVIAICSKEGNVNNTKGKLIKKGNCSNDFEVLSANVKNEDEVSNVASYIKKKYGNVNYLVNCAGVMEPEAVTSDLEKMENWDEVINVNLRGTFLVCKYMIPILRKKENAHIINFSGGLGLLSSGMLGGTLSAYRISKSAVNALTLILSEELKDDEIMVNSIDPGWVKTDMGGGDAPKLPEMVAEEVYRILMKKFSSEETGKLFKEDAIIDY